MIKYKQNVIPKESKMNPSNSRFTVFLFTIKSNKNTNNIEYTHKNSNKTIVLKGLNRVLNSDMLFLILSLLLVWQY
jgi:hypothetical protein